MRMTGSRILPQLLRGSERQTFIAHVHATEFDRSGENVNQEIYEMERQGMQAADKIIAVSRFTRNIIITRYGIHPDKVKVVHNAVMPMTHQQRRPERYFLKAGYLPWSCHISERAGLFRGSGLQSVEER